MTYALPRGCGEAKVIVNIPVLVFATVQLVRPLFSSVMVVGVIPVGMLNTPVQKYIW